MSFNAVTGALLERRSTKSYIPNQQVPWEVLQTILTAAQFAPSAMGEQARHFTVIQNADFIKELTDCTLKLMSAAGRTPSRPNVPFYHAPTIIICSAPKGAKWGHDDVACSIMNMMHTAHSYGLGTCYIGAALGIYDKEMQKKFHLPNTYEPIACMAVGYQQDAPAPAKPRRTDNITYI